MLQDCPLQLPVANLPGLLQGLGVAVLSLLGAALLPQNRGYVPKPGDSVTVAPQGLANGQGVLCRAESLVKTPGVLQRIGEIAQGGGKVHQLSSTGVALLAGRRGLVGAEMRHGHGRRQNGPTP